AERRAGSADDLHDLLRTIGDLTRLEISARCTTDPSDWLQSLIEQRRVIPVTIAGDERLAAAEDAARLRDGLGVALPIGLPAAFTEPVDDPLTDLVARYARTHGPFVTHDVGRRFGIGADRVETAL